MHPTMAFSRPWKRVHNDYIGTDDRKSDIERFWFDFIGEAYRVGEEAHRKVAREYLPALLQEETLRVGRCWLTLCSLACARPA